jgi:phage shock protein PspC (stress-responsive transcriptional regulator)
MKYDDMKYDDVRYDDAYQGHTDNGGSTVTATRKLRRSRSDRMVAGVCGGVAKYFRVDVALVRVLLVAATVLGFGTGAVLYLICWLIVPEED